MRSQEAGDGAAVEHWCLGHAEETGHKRFRAVVTTFLVIVPAPGRGPATRPEPGSASTQEAPPTRCGSG
ncbi:DUF7848 domain-containing protein [Streptomyces sp. NPDC004673]